MASTDGLELSLCTAVRHAVWYNASLKLVTAPFGVWRDHERYMRSGGPVPEYGVSEEAKPSDYVVECCNKHVAAMRLVEIQWIGFVSEFTYDTSAVDDNGLDFNFIDTVLFAKETRALIPLPPEEIKRESDRRRYIEEVIERFLVTELMMDVHSMGGDIMYASAGVSGTPRLVMKQTNRTATKGKNKGKDVQIHNGANACSFVIVDSTHKRNISFKLFLGNEKNYGKVKAHISGVNTVAEMELMTVFVHRFMYEMYNNMDSHRVRSVTCANMLARVLNWTKRFGIDNECENVTKRQKTGGGLFDRITSCIPGAVTKTPCDNTSGLKHAQFVPPPQGKDGNARLVIKCYIKSLVLTGKVTLRDFADIVGLFATVDVPKLRAYKTR